MSQRLELFLFAGDPGDAREAGAGGVDALVVDWERSGKRQRQRGADTEINERTVEDLEAIAATGAAPVICRLDGCDPAGAVTALDAGADEVLLPMVRRPGDVEPVIAVAGAGRVGILIETCDAVACANELAQLPLARVYVGLNDLAIERRAETIFDAVADGTVESIREAFAVPFGFGGATIPAAGRPIPAPLLLAEMARLDCAFTFLRRSYRRDLAAAGGHRHAIRSIREFFAEASGRSPERRRTDHGALIAAVEALRRNPSYAEA